MSKPAPDYLSGAHSPEAAFLTRVGSSLFVPVPVRRLERPALLWLNHRWFLQRGVDTLNSEIRASVEAWLLSNFAVQTCLAETGSAPPRSRLTYAAVERYGGTGGSAQGGSGRTITIGDFNAKGTGATPLVSRDVEPSYTTGFMPLREALRETIMSEIAHAELPYGAVPILCIIDPAEDFSFDPQRGPEPRAIVVRTNFVRPAHFERSIFFGSAGTERSDQFLDATRVRESVKAALLWEHHTADGLLDPEPMFARLARQIGVARAHRLWLGRFLTSNASVTGACVDFGSFRAVTNWVRAYGRTSEVFGDEEEQIARAARSLCFYFNKHGPNRRFDGDAVAANSRKALQDGFREASASALGLQYLGGAADRISSLLLQYYGEQQHRRVPVDDERAYRGSWIYDRLRGVHVTGEAPPGSEAKSCDEIVRQLKAAARGRSSFLIGRALRWLRPRPILYYKIADSRARTAANSIRRSIGTSNASEYVCRALSAGRRLWPNLPKELDVVEQFVRPHFAALKCIDRLTLERVLWIEAFVVAEKAYIVDDPVPLPTLERYCVHRVENRMCLRIPWDVVGRLSGNLRTLSGGYRY